MISLRTSVGRVWRLLLSVTVLSGTAISSAQAGFSDPPLLAGLQLQSGSGPIGFAPAPLSPVFDSYTQEYDISIPFEHDDVRVVSAPVIEDEFGLHGSEVGTIPPLLPGQTTSFTIVAADAPLPPYFQTTTYTINVTRGASNNVAVLSNLVVSGTTVSPSFGQLTFDYAGSVTNGTTSITVTPTAQSAGTSTITVNGGSATSGNPFGPVPLSVGSNEIIILVMDGDVTKAYVLDITRLAANVDTDNDGMEDNFETVNGLNVGIDDSQLDLDGDGLNNLSEFAFGSNPNDFSDHNDPVVSRNASGFLTITFDRAIDPSEGSYQVEVSSTLSAWSSTQVTEEGISTPTVQVWRDTFGGSATPPPTRFIRVLFTSSL